jgi:hypothetical protein
MAVLSTQLRTDIWAELQRTPDNPGGITKADLQAAVDAADDWVDANSNSFNTALPTAARTVMTAKQKARLLLHVVEKRWGVA